MATTPLLSVPCPCSQNLVTSFPHANVQVPPANTSSRSLYLPPRPVLSPLLCVPSSTTSASLVDDALPSASQESSPEESGPFSGCKTCGKEEIERGCNGEGRIQGGIATVPGFGWWPIKAYRPCPGFVASGGRYRRQGQSMDEVAFGREERETSLGTDDDVDARKKGRDQRRFKR